MLALIFFAFLAGVVTILSPCILPLLPIILSSAGGTGKSKPVGVVIGFVASFTFFTLFLTSIVQATGISADSLRLLSIIVLAVFGASLLIPQLQLRLEILFSRLASHVPPASQKKGLVGGLLIGLSLGLLWTPCVGPILAAVISLAITGEVTGQAVIITFSYALGTAVPMFVIMVLGSTALQKVPWLVRNTARIQKVFGVLMILTAVAIYFNLDRRFQTLVLTTFPNYGVGLTAFEEASIVQENLTTLNQQDAVAPMVGKTLSQVNQTKGPVAPELISGGDWFNSNPLRLADLRGKVVLVDFWTYSCINCQRTLPYLKQWWEQYSDAGLLIVGVHAPEFEFEKNPSNVKKAIADFGLLYPIMQDNEFATWRAYNNRYWPAKYLIDKDGLIRYNHFGEGKYEETEQMIQMLLAETGATVSGKPSVINAQRNYARTPELYLGFARLTNLVSPENVKQDEVTVFTSPSTLAANSIGLSGSWLMTSEFAAPKAGARLKLNFDAQDVYLVARPAGGETGTMKVYLDGKQIENGYDVQRGSVMVDSDRLYHLLRLPNPGRHQLELEFSDDSVAVFAFTFG